MNEPFEVANQLTEEIEAAKLTRREVLAEAGVSRANFWRWLQNVYSPRKASVTAIRNGIEALSV